MGYNNTITCFNSCRYLFSILQEAVYGKKNVIEFPSAMMLMGFEADVVN